MKQAFTLSEVLITLGIVGVVAALTIPALLANYRKKVLASRLKKSYSVIQNTINTVNTENGLPFECYTLPGADYHYTECDQFFENFVKQLQVVNICKNSDKSCRPKYKSKAEVIAEGGSCPNNACSLPINEHTAYNLSDGSMIFVYDRLSHNKLFFGVDVNGSEGPNQWGYDLFYLNLFRQNTTTAVIGITAVCELIEKGGQSFEDAILN